MSKVDRRRVQVSNLHGEEDLVAHTAATVLAAFLIAAVARDRAVRKQPDRAGVTVVEWRHAAQHVRDEPRAVLYGRATLRERRT